MVEFKVPSERRKCLLEQIGAAADEIKSISAERGLTRQDCARNEKDYSQSRY